MMRIAVLEAVCAGMCGQNPPPSLLAEGTAMWRAIIEDLLAVPEISIETIRPHRTSDPKVAMSAWNDILERANAAWIIAPESDKLLEQLVAATPAEFTIHNAAPSAIRLCADKLAIARHLEQHGVTTIPTMAETWETPPEFDGKAFVIKPRDGAGSQLVRFVDDLTSWEITRFLYRAEGDVQAIRQPFVSGVPLSIAGWFHSGGVQWFPVAEQVLDRNFTYHGGIIPGIHRSGQLAVQRLAAAAATTIPGLRGYIGFDVLFPLKTSFLKPVLVEINPRMTTSSIGYRRLCAEPWLASLLADPQRALTWRRNVEIRFRADGVVEESVQA